MPRTRRISSAKAQLPFGDALSFCSIILRDKGTVNETHVRIDTDWITAFNGTFAIGCKFNSPLQACPHIKLVLEALAKCKDEIGIAFDGRLLIKSGKFKASIPCVDFNLIELSIPDPPQVDIDERLKIAFETANLLKTDDGQTIYSASFLINGQSLIASLSGQMIMEYWHGISLPQGPSVPKSFANIISKINKKPVKIGFSQWSMTIYFDDESWIRTQLFAEQWPDIGHLFDIQTDLKPFPADFWNALVAVSPFGEGMILADGKTLRSLGQNGASAEFQLESHLGSWTYPARQLALLQPWASVVDFHAQSAHGHCLIAMGKNARAIIAGVRNA